MHTGLSGTELGDTEGRAVTSPPRQLWDTQPTWSLCVLSPLWWGRGSISEPRYWMCRDLGAPGITTAQFAVCFLSVLLLKAKFVSVLLLTLSNLVEGELTGALQNPRGFHRHKAKNMS